MIQFTVNAESHTRESGITVRDFLKEKGLSPGNVIVELNQKVLKRESFENTSIAEGDTLEVIRAFAGG